MMKRDCLTRFCAIAVSSLATVLFAGGDEDGTRPQYVAYGTGYYWFYGLEMTSGRGVWGGPDPLWCFKEDVLDKLPEDFPDQVIARLKRDYGLADGREEVARRVYEGILFGHCDIAFTWFQIVGVSEDPKLAADVVNASMDLYYEFDLAKRKADRVQGLDSAKAGIARYSAAIEDMESRLKSPNGPEDEKRWQSGLEYNRKMLAHSERELSRIEALDPVTNTMFKAMVRPTVATNLVDAFTSRELKHLAKTFKILENRKRERQASLERQKEHERQFKEILLHSRNREQK